jgi:hypothetical protein
VIAVRDTGAVLAMAARLLWRHWPVLFALFLAGFGGRELVMIAAVHVSDVHGVLGFLVLVLAPITTLTALVLMLRTVRPSLPWLAAAGRAATDLGTGRPRALLDHLGSVLVPFLAVYASYGYLKRDTSEYLYRVWQAETLSNAEIFTAPGKVDVAHRLPFVVGAVLFAVVAVAVTLRWLLARWEGARRRPWLGLLGAYVEVIWITLIAGLITQLHGSATDWLAERRVVRWLTDLWNSTVDSLGPLARPVHGTGSWLWGLLADIDVVIVVPLAWLAVGAVVYGHKLAAPLPDHDFSSAAAQRWSIVPGAVRKVAADLSTDVRSRFAPLIDGVRLLVRTGAAPMLLFCVAFVVAQTASAWLWELERLVIGPQDLNVVWRPLSGPLSVLNDAVGTVLLACLLGAAVDRVLRVPGLASPAGPDAPTPPPPAERDPATQPAMSRA